MVSAGKPLLYAMNAAPESVSVALDEQSQDCGDDRNDDRACDGVPPELLDVELDGCEAGQPRSEQQHQRIDHDREQAQRQAGDRQGEELDDRTYKGVNQTEDDSNNKVGDCGAYCAIADGMNLQAGNNPNGGRECQSINDDSNEEAHALTLS